MPQSQIDTERVWLERELEALRTRETQYRERLARRDALGARLLAHTRLLHQLFRERPASRNELRRTLLEAARISARALRVQRTSVWSFDDSRQHLICIVELVGDVEVDNPNESLEVTSCPNYLRALSEDGALAVERALQDPRTQELADYVKKHGLASMLDIPVAIPGSMLGVVCHEYGPEPRIFERSEIEFASNVGNIVALSLESDRRTRAELAERDTEAKYRHLVESLPVTVYSFDVHTGRLDYVSPRIADLGGWSPQTWLGKGAGAWIERVVEADRGPVLDRFRRGAAGGFPEEIVYRVRVPDGGMRWIRDTCHVVRDHLGKALAFQGVLADITKQTEAERSRSELERMYRSVLESSGLIAATLDPTGHILYANTALQKLAGRSGEELMGRDWFELMLPASTRAEIRKHYLVNMANGTVVPRAEVEIETASGEARQLLSTNTVLLGADGKPVGVTSWAVDVTERRRLESELLQQTKLEGLGRLAAGVAHDFNNLLTVLVTELALLEDRRVALGVTEDEESNQHLEALRQAVSQASDLTRSLLLYGRKPPARDEIFVLDDLIRENIPLIEAVVGRELHVTTSLHAPEASLKLDPSRVRQVLLNLVGNAADATAEDGHDVRIGTYIELFDEALARRKGAVAGGEFVVLEVADDGRGIDPRTLGHVFEPFFTTKLDGHGTGLGLAVAQTIANQAGGFITAESVVGHGATFRVHLPLRTEARASSATSASNGHGTGSVNTARSKKRVLVVNGDTTTRETVSNTLRGAGYDTAGAVDTSSAAEVLASEAIDLLISDVDLPDGSGIALAKGARNVRPGLRVLLMCEAGEELEETLGNKLEKPFDEEHVLELVKALLG